MDKKESPKANNNALPQDKGQNKQGKGKLNEAVSGLSLKVFTVIKLMLGICFLPIVYSVTAAFLKVFGTIEKPLQSVFWYGVISFIVIFFFVRDSDFFYLKGQRLLEIIFSFFAPLVKVAPYLLPIYAIVMVSVYSIVSLFIKNKELPYYLMFFLGFSVASHLVFSARTLRGKKEDALKANYIFGFSFVYILNIVLVAFCCAASFQQFSLSTFFNETIVVARLILKMAFKQLFMP